MHKQMTHSSEYTHRWKGGEEISLPVGKVVCVGRNYAEHAKELNNPVPKEPLLFMKPATSIVDFEQPIQIPTQFGEVHYESEIAILIGEKLSSADMSLDAIQRSIYGVGASLDLTLRELQSSLKEKGQPWEKAKAFDGSCPLTSFVQKDQISSLSDLSIALTIDEQLVQSGSSSDMLTPIVDLLAYITRFFTLMPGDVVLTGTPKGVGAITPDQSLTLILGDALAWTTCTVAEA
jgi:2-keto-4-pentenoate hydratase/2-oxohepta-3-ene-1,7-dioic acid hydratase in catechol pathway